MRSASSKKSDDASSSLGDMANPSSKLGLTSINHRLVLTRVTEGGQTTAGTSISGGQQAQNMNTGSADHLDLGFRKE